MLVSVLLVLLNTSVANPMVGRSPGIFNDGNRGGRIRTRECNCSFETLSVAAMGNVANKGRIALTMLVALGAGISGFALSKSIPLSCLILFASGAVLMCAFAMISSLVQLITSNEMRGRVMSVYNVAFRGGMPFGSVVTGWLVPLLTAPTVLSINGLVLLSLGLYFLLVQRRVAAL